MHAGIVLLEGFLVTNVLNLLKTFYLALVG